MNFVPKQILKDLLIKSDKGQNNKTVTTMKMKIEILECINFGRRNEVMPKYQCNYNAP